MEHLISNKFILDGTAETVMHPARYKILAMMGESKEPQFVDQIAKATEIHPRMVSHHLDVLEDKGLISCEYKLMESKKSKREVAVRLCSLQPKATEVMDAIKESVEEGL